MEFDLRLDIFALLILLGGVQGFFLASFFLFDSKSKSLPHRMLGWLILAVTLVTLELLLNYTGYITRVIYLDNFSESVGFALGPLLYLYIRTSLEPKWWKKYWLHFIPFLVYTLYMVFYFAQPDEVKFNAYLWAYHPEVPRLEAMEQVPADPLFLREWVNLLILVSFVFYGIKSWRILLKHLEGKQGATIWNPTDQNLAWLRNFLLHFFVVGLLFALVKLIFGRDLGDYIIASYLAFLMYVTNFNVIRNRVNQTPENQERIAEKPKYEKSSLSDNEKGLILQKIKHQMDQQQYYANNLASLKDLAQRLAVPPHHLSQVINEKLEINFFELLAKYRVEKAKEILSDTGFQQLTIEEVAERVGYNSKSAFNKVFKKHTGFTPTEFRSR